VQDFKNAIRAAFEQGIIDRNVGLPVKPLPTEDSELRGEFTIAEIRKLIATATPDWKGAILIAAQTGLRLSNIAELDWSEVHLKTRELILTPVKQRKGKAEVIAIPMTDSVFQFLKKRAHGRKISESPVFSRPRRAPESDPQHELQKPHDQGGDSARGSPPRRSHRCAQLPFASPLLRFRSRKRPGTRGCAEDIGGTQIRGNPSHLHTPQQGDVAQSGGVAS
jgi:integrase